MVRRHGASVLGGDEVSWKSREACWAELRTSAIVTVVVVVCYLAICGGYCRYGWMVEYGEQERQMGRRRPCIVGARIKVCTKMVSEDAREQLLQRFVVVQFYCKRGPKLLRRVPVLAASYGRASWKLGSSTRGMIVPTTDCNGNGVHVPERGRVIEDADPAATRN